MGANSSSDPASQNAETDTGTIGTDTLTGGLGDAVINGDSGNDVLASDGAIRGTGHYETYDYNFSSAHGQAFHIESGTRSRSGYVSDFDEGNLTNAIRGTTGSPEDFGVIYTSTLDLTTGGAYRLTTSSDGGSTIQVFDSSGNALDFSSQTAASLIIFTTIPISLVIPPKISGVQKPNFLGKISEEIFDEDSTVKRRTDYALPGSTCLHV